MLRYYANIADREPKGTIKVKDITDVYRAPEESGKDKKCVLVVIALAFKGFDAASPPPPFFYFVVLASFGLHSVYHNGNFPSIHKQTNKQNPRTSINLHVGGTSPPPVSSTPS